MEGGRRCFASLVLLMVLQLAFFTANSGATRSHPYDLQQLLSGAAAVAAGRGFVGAGEEEPCCTCMCPPIYPPRCFCAGQWEGSCPAACTNCDCDDSASGKCRCQDGLMEGDKCWASDCNRPRRASSEKK